MKFRPCIDIHNGKVKQLVGGSLKDKGNQADENFVSEKDAAEFALCYSEAVRNRDYQDYGRNNGGRLWS